MWTRIVLVVSLLLGAYAASYAFPSARAQHEHDQRSQPAGMADMMKVHQQMMMDMKAADAKLEPLLRTMNAATGEPRVSAIADVVNELVSQQKAMHERMSVMHDQMMGQMMGGRGMMTPKR